MLRTTVLALGFMAALTSPEAVQAANPTHPDKVRNVILLIGDGMGPQQIGLLSYYAHNAPHSVYNGRTPAIEQLMNEGVTGVVRTNPAHALVVDSAAAATQLATGKLAPSEALGVDEDGHVVDTVLERAERMGKATGLVSDTRITHATPAAFGAHVAHRSQENEIAVQLLNADVDVMLSGGLRHWIPKSVNEKGATHDAIRKQTGGHIKIKSKRKDERNLLAEAEAKGYALSFDRTSLMQAKGDKLLGLYAYSGMDDGIRYTRSKNDPGRWQPSLAEMTRKALDVLSRDPDGFFLMVEGGQIDWAGHNNDAATMLHEMLKFDEAVQVVIDWAKNRKDTLVVLTADHETGSFGFSYSRANIPTPENLKGEVFRNHPYRPNFNFGDFSLLDRIYNQKLSFADMFDEWRSGEKTPERLMAIVNANSEFDITLDEARAILADEPNTYRVKGHSYLDAETFPKVCDFKAFYVYGDEVRTDLLARMIAEDQNVVWGTGTHTSTPVTVTALGPQGWEMAFSRIQHATQVGQVINAALGADK